MHLLLGFLGTLNEWEATSRKASYPEVFILGKAHPVTVPVNSPTEVPAHSHLQLPAMRCSLLDIQPRGLFTCSKPKSTCERMEQEWPSTTLPKFTNHRITTKRKWLFKAPEFWGNLLHSNTSCKKSLNFQHFSTTQGFLTPGRAGTSLELRDVSHHSCQIDVCSQIDKILLWYNNRTFPVYMNL